MNTAVTSEEKRALLNLKPAEPDLVVTVRADLYRESMLVQDQRGKPLGLLWKRYDYKTKRITLAFSEGR